MTISFTPALLFSKVRTGIKAQAKAAKVVTRASGAVCMFGDNRKAAAAAIAVALAVTAPAFPARADLTSDLLERTAANKELNDKKRMATSSANFERSRTITDQTCAFPNNFFGCEIYSSSADVKFLSAVGLGRNCWQCNLTRVKPSFLELNSIIRYFERFLPSPTPRTRRWSARAPATARSAPPRPPAPSPRSAACKRFAHHRHHHHRVEAFKPTITTTKTRGVARRRSTSFLKEYQQYQQFTTT